MTQATAVAFTRATCSWCGSTRLKRSSSSTCISVCEACGIGVTDPPPTEAELAHAYAGSYRPPGGRFAGPGDRFLRWSRGLLARRLDRIAPAGPVLDVGSGDGSLLLALRGLGRHAEGVEPGRAGGARFGDIGEVSGEWAAVVFWHSLEHVRQPAEALASARRLLAPGGVVVVAAPNIDSVQANVFGGRWFALDLPRHLVHLSPRVIATRLRGLGFEVERVSAVRGGQSVFGWLHGLVGVIPGTADLYDAIRRPNARSRPMHRVRRTATLAASLLALPAALVAAAGEAALGRGGSFYVEARRV